MLHANVQCEQLASEKRSGLFVLMTGLRPLAGVVVEFVVDDVWPLSRMCVCGHSPLRQYQVLVTRIYISSHRPGNTLVATAREPVFLVDVFLLCILTCAGTRCICFGTYRRRALSCGWEYASGSAELLQENGTHTILRASSVPPMATDSGVKNLGRYDGTGLCAGHWPWETILGILKNAMDDLAAGKRPGLLPEWHNKGCNLGFVDPHVHDRQRR